MSPISQIKLEREDTKIKLTLPYNPTYIKKIKTIPQNQALCAIVFLYKHVLNKNGYVPNLFTLKMSICSHRNKCLYVEIKRDSKLEV